MSTEGDPTGTEYRELGDLRARLSQQTPEIKAQGEIINQLSDVLRSYADEIKGDPDYRREYAKTQDDLWLLDLIRLSISHGYFNKRADIAPEEPWKSLHGEGKLALLPLHSIDAPFRNRLARLKIMRALGVQLPRDVDLDILSIKQDLKETMRRESGPIEGPLKIWTLPTKIQGVALEIVMAPSINVLEFNLGIKSQSTLPSQMTTQPI